jgi:hypothetical protein
MQGFINYFGTDYGFIGCLMFYFPLGVIVIGGLLTFLTRKVSVSPIVIALVFGSFFLYAYSQFDAVATNFIIPLISYIIISILVSYLLKSLLKKR